MRPFQSFAKRVFCMSKAAYISVVTALLLLSPISRAGLIYDLSSSSDPTTFGFIELDTVLGGTWSVFDDILSFDLTIDGFNLSSASGAGVAGCFGCFGLGPVTPTDPFGDPALANSFTQDSGDSSLQNLFIGSELVSRLDAGTCVGGIVSCWNNVGGTLVRDISWTAREQVVPAPGTIALVFFGLLALGRRRIKLPS